MNKLNKLISENKPKIDITGRVCHHRIEILYALTELNNLQNYLEIGVHNGSSLSYVLQSNKNKNCIGIDPFETLQTKDHSMIHYINKDNITQEKTLKNLRKNNKYNSNIKLIKKLSKNVLDKEINHNIDLLFIDGDHNYKAVLDDYNKFSKYVKSGGFIVFDDLHQDGPKKCFNEIVKTDKNVKLFGIYKETEGILEKL
jgi:predicted O-methyltransferase YrrM